MRSEKGGVGRERRGRGIRLLLYFIGVFWYIVRWGGRIESACRRWSFFIVKMFFLVFE